MSSKEKKTNKRKRKIHKKQTKNPTRYQTINIINENSTRIAPTSQTIIMIIIQDCNYIITSEGTKQAQKEYKNKLGFDNANKWYLPNPETSKKES